MRNALVALLLAVLALPQLAAQSSVPPELIRYPDLIFHNGKVLTVDENFRIAEAVAIRDDAFLAVGSNQEVLRLRGPQTRVVDLAGKTAIPGFVATDADNDFVGGNIYKETLIGGKILGTLRNVRTKAEILEEVGRQAAIRPEGEMLFFRLPEESADGMNMTRADLDPISPLHPVALNVTSFDMVLNTLMLEKLIERMPGGEKNPAILKDPSTGKPNGQIFGQAMGTVGWDMRPWPKIDEAMLEEQKRMLHDLNKAGITSMVAHLQGFNLTVLNALWHRDELTMRVYAAHDFLRQNPNAEAFLRRIGNLIDFGLGDMVQIIAAGLSAMDGNADTGSALTLEPKVRSGGYAFAPQGQNTWLGYGPHKNTWANNTIPKEMTEWNNLQVAIKYGWNTTGIHNVGDQATAIWLQSIDEGLQQPDLVLKPQEHAPGVNDAAATEAATEPTEPSKPSEPEDERDFALTFSRAAGSPGGEIALPVYFTRRPGAANVGKVRVRLTYPGETVAFKNAEDAYLSRRAGIEIKAEEEEASGGQAALEVTFTLPSPSEKNFPSGQLAFLHFTVPSDATDATVPLKPELWIDDQPVTADSPLARAEEGRLIITTKPIFVGCFIFSH